MNEIHAWCKGLFAAIDAKDSCGFADYLTSEADFCFANAPPVTGTARIIEALDAFFREIASLEHQIRDAWDLPGHRICRGAVRYTRLDGAQVTAPFCNVFTMDHGKVSRYEIYLDPSGLSARR